MEGSILLIVYFSCNGRDADGCNIPGVETSGAAIFLIGNDDAEDTCIMLANPDDLGDLGAVVKPISRDQINRVPQCIRFGDVS